MQDECVGAKIDTPTHWASKSLSYLWKRDQITTLSNEFFSITNKNCGKLSFKIHGLDNNTFKINSNAELGVQLIGSESDTEKIGTKQFTIKACQGLDKSCVNSPPLTIQVIDSCKYNEILPFTVPDIVVTHDQTIE